MNWAFDRPPFDRLRENGNYWRSIIERPWVAVRLRLTLAIPKSRIPPNPPLFLDPCPGVL
jgi:hypothetical protein